MAQASREERKKKVIEVLNQARAMELQAIYQYMNQHYNLDSMDYGELAKNIKLIAIDEMRHAESFAERIKELGGEPTSEMAGRVEKGQPVEKIEQETERDRYLTMQEAKEYGLVDEILEPDRAAKVVAGQPIGGQPTGS